MTKIIEVTITNRCNHKCQYCFECGYTCTESREEEIRQLDLISDTCSSFVPSTETDIVQISMWGGEPMLNTRFIYDIIDHTVKYPFVHYYIYTNGTLFNEWQDFVGHTWFKDILPRLVVRMSYDGEPHQSITRYPGDVTLQTWRMLRAHGVNAFFKSTLMLKHTDLLPEIREDFLRLHEEDSTVEYFPNLDTMDNDPSYLDSFKSAMKQVAHLELQRVKDRLLPIMGWFRPFIRKNRCSLSNMVHMHTDGNLYQCHGGPYCRNCSKISLGKTSTIASLDPYIRDYGTIPENPKCANCEAVFCLVCHIACIPDPQSPEDVVNRWEACRCHDSNRCKYYQFFGRLHRAFWEAFKYNKPALIDAVE